MKKLTLAVIISALAFTAFAGSDSKVVMTPGPPPVVSPYASSEFNVSLLGSGIWTQTAYRDDRYFGADHAFGGTLQLDYFFATYFGVGLSGSGYDVRNISTPARVATSNDPRRFVGDLLINATFRYPIGTSPLAPYARVGFGIMGNGGIAGAQEPSCSAGCVLQFEKVEHDVKGVEEVAVGVEYRINHNWGIKTEVAGDKVNRPHSNFATIRAGVDFAF